MQTKKMILANIKGKLSRTEMKNVTAGTGGGNCKCYSVNSFCPVGQVATLACNFGGGTYQG